MIKQSETHDKLVFGVDFKTKTKRVQKVEKPVAPPTPKPEKLCQFQELKELRSQGPYVFFMGSSQCEKEALENGWCKEHQDAQIGMDLGAKINYRSIEIPVVSYGDGREPFKIILGQGEDNWREYFGKARGKGLATVLNYLQSRIQ